jgi:hypothetical protein
VGVIWGVEGVGEGMTRGAESEGIAGSIPGFEASDPELSDPELSDPELSDPEPPGPEPRDPEASATVSSDPTSSAPDSLRPPADPVPRPCKQTISRTASTSASKSSWSL